MKRIIFIMSAFGILLAAPAALTSCQEDAPEINYTINITVVNDFTKVVEAINNGSLKNEEAIKALTDAIDKMSADQATKLQSIVDVLNSVNTTLDTKLAAVEAALKAQTLSLETKMDLLDKAIKGLTTSMEDKMDLLEKAVKALTASIDQMNADQAAKLQALTEALTSVGSSLEAKLALIEAAVNAQTLSLETKMDLLDKALKALTTSMEDKMDLLEKAIKALTASIDQMNADQAAKLQALTEALTSVGSSLEAKLALIEAAVNAQTLSLEGKLDLLRQAIEALPDYTERLAAIETAIKGLPDYTDKLDAIKVAIEALPDYSEKFDAVTTALDSLRQNLKASEKDLAEKVAGVSAAIKSLIDSVDNGNESAAAALEKIIARLEELKTYLGDLNKKEEYVDLGLSVKWAARNLGADKPSDHGYYFAWGETEPKVDFSWATYKWMLSGKSNFAFITKYTCDDRYLAASWYDKVGSFIGDGKTVLDAEDDAATAALGVLWRMPSPDEFVELFSKCTYEYAEQDGVKGLRLTGGNGNSIFLPSVPPFGYSEAVLGGSYYWSSSLSGFTRSVTDMASSPGFSLATLQDDTKDASIDFEMKLSRFIGLPVRPVRP